MLGSYTTIFRHTLLKSDKNNHFFHKDYTIICHMMGGLFRLRNVTTVGYFFMI
jgi:hypothetical protein